ncbi:polysaccharide deacetylase family protein [Thermosipho ferrireducens]|uniref:Polysaccharide deacetylase family protein n=1 Tax=Thermosipho ferrireducens TaxID=2571116 RepID=A0ABX7SA26_9BACT|nr:polysaccharide deacetylase family protein [Thermosipho ferrireducens]QTA38811.1 polysaccharide deacetylase family protein [Thermosipho ferrireducens]
MRRIIFFLLLIILSFTSFSNIVIFIYHRFDDERYPTTNTWISELELHIKMVKRLGYKVWTLKDLEDYIYGRKEKENAVIFTIDDGYVTVYTKAFPVFKKYDVPFSVFLYFKGVGNSSEYLTWDMIREMKEWGVEFGNHSYSHEKFPSFYEKLGRKKFIEFFEKDLQQGEEIWEKHMGTRLKYYAYPYGYYNKDMINILKKHGYVLAFMQLSGPYTKEISPYEIPREALLEDWATEEHVRYILSREALIVEGTPYYWKDGKFYVKARIVYPEYIKNQVVYIREKGIVSSKKAGDNIVAGPFVINNEYNSLMISVRGKDNKEYVRYFLIRKQSY